MPYHFYNPVRIHHGSGSLACLRDEVAGRRAVLVTFPEACALGLVDQASAACGVPFERVIDTVEPNPDVRQLAPMYADFWQRHGDCEVIVALGGGSALDTAKVLMTDAGGGDFSRLLDGLRGAKPWRAARALPLITIPTTAGTGSEVTPWATVWDHGEHPRKYSLHLDETWPHTAIVDPCLTHSLPASVTLQSGLDALSHALESVWNVNSNPVSDTFAVAAARDMLDTLPALMADLNSAALRERASLAALKAGLAFSNTKTALAHSISYEMTLRHGLPHGIACSFLLPRVMRLALGCRPDRDAVLSRIFPVALGEAPDWLTDWLARLGVKTQFTDYGVSNEESEHMVSRALTGPRGRNFIGAAGTLAA